jgi:hypothetical protein
MVPAALRFWFVVHFAADIIFAIPLIFFPGEFMGLWGFESAETLTARLTGAALAGIGGNSLFMHKKGIPVFDTMLTLKIIWSLSAIAAIIITITEGGPASLYLFLLIFLVFSLLWIYWKFRIMSLLK